MPCLKRVKRVLVLRTGSHGDDYHRILKSFDVDNYTSCTDILTLNKLLLCTYCSLSP